MKNLNENVIVLAGATGRVGGETLRILAEREAHVAVVSRSKTRGEALLEGLNSDERARVRVIEGDLSNAASGIRIAEIATTWRGRVDAAVSLAGGGTAFVSIVDSTADDMEASIRNNLLVAYNLFVPLLRYMLKQPIIAGAQSRARLVAVTAGSSLTPQPRFGIMGAGKAGVNLLMRAIAREHKADGIVSNAVVLGTVAVASARDYLDDAAFAAAATPREVAEILAFHASDASSGVNGELIHLNAREVD
ncbi:MAG TPA: SDR family oxidoreductase [Candidatus Acidoferrales bacterium]|nr:SDR family oxidoreductase [Candidatus Acidoferrales bacterium]